MSLFENPRELDLGDGAWLRYVPGWLAPTEADRVRQELTRTMTWEQREIQLFGRPVLQPRLVAWAGEISYCYSRLLLEPRPIPQQLEAILEQVRQAAEQPFNHVLLNRYRDGNDSMGFHSDDEPELGPEPVLASVSLGAPRRFRVVPKKRRSGAAFDLDLEHGSLLVMGGQSNNRPQPKSADQHPRRLLRLGRNPI